MPKNNYYQLFSSLLSRFGINADIKGYKYIVFMCSEIMSYSTDFSFTTQRLSLKALYHMAAVKYHTNVRAVTRCVMYAVQKILDGGNTDLLDEVYGLSLTSRSGTVRVKSFVYGLCNYANNFSDDVII